jgi:hypothetical protein
MSDEFRVVFRFLPGPATVSQDVMGRKLSGQIKEELLHETHNAVLWRLFLSFMSRTRQGDGGLAQARMPSSNAMAEPRKLPLKAIRRQRPSGTQAI